MSRTPWICAGVLFLLACLEPNPYAVDSGETGTSASTSNGDGDGDGDGDTGNACDPCDLGFETVSFEAGPNGFVGQVPKPPQANTAAFALVREYVPGNADNVGYEMIWEDVGDAWELTVELTDAAPNSRVRGLAVVLGSNGDLYEDTTNVSVDEGCDDSTVDPLDGRAIVDVIERYDPSGGEVLSYEREANTGNNSATVGYCISESESVDASLRFKIVSFEIPEGVTAMTAIDVTLDSSGPESTNDQIPNASDVLYAIGVREFDEAAAPGLGYAIDCSATAPYGCNMDLRDFSDGARAVVGGVIVAIP